MGSGGEAGHIDPDFGNDDRGREGADAWDRDEPLGDGTKRKRKIPTQPVSRVAAPAAMMTGAEPNHANKVGAAR